MKKIFMFLFIGLIFASCGNGKPKKTYTPKYKNNEYVYYTQPGKTGVDTLFGQIDELFGETILWSDSTFKYRIKYKLDNGEFGHTWVFENSIIKK
jgi:hypothetical protein